MDEYSLALVSTVELAVQMETATGDVLARSPAWSALVPGADASADAWLARVLEDDRDRVSGILDADRAARAGTRLQVRITDAEGQLRWWTAHRVPVTEDDDLRGWVTVLAPTVDRALPGDVAWREQDTLRAAQQVARMGAWDWDIETGTLWWSDEVYRIFGLRAQEFPATYAAFLDHVHPDDRAEVERRVASAVQGSERYDLRHRVVQPDGSVRFVREQGSVTRAEDGSPVRMLGTVLDVTEETLHEQERERALEALAESESRYRLLAENSSDFVALTDADLTVEWVSDSVTRVLGWTPDQIVGSPALDLLHPEDRQRAETDVGRPGDTGATQARYRLRCADGTYRWISSVGRTIVDESGRPTSYVSGFRDVQAEVQAEQAAAASLAAVEAERLRLRAVMDAVLDPHVVLEAIRDDSGRIVDFVHVDANRAADAHVQALGQTLKGKRLLDVTPGQAAAGLMAMYAHVVETGEPLVADSVPYADEAYGGELRLFDMRGVRVGDAISLTFRDVTDRVAEAQALTRSEARYRLLAENASDVIWQLASDGRVVWVSESVTPVLGWQPADVVGRGWDLIHPDDRPRVRWAHADRSRPGPTTGQMRVATADGAWRWMAVTTRIVPSEDGDGYVVSLRDIEDEMTARSLLEHALGHDPLTGLATREVTVNRLEGLLASGHRDRRPVGVLCAAVDSLGDVVSALGHSAGDLLLTTVVTRMVSAIGEPDRISRGSGNEFFVLLPELSSPADAALVAENLRRQVRGPVLVLGEIVDPTISVGITTGVAGDDAERLLRDATLAMRQAKAQGRDRDAFADPDLAVAARDRLAVEAGIREALKESQYVAWFQPIVELASGATTGYEALVRWIRPDGTVVSPAEFLPVAEATGLVTDLDLVVLEQAVAVLAGLPAPMTVAVNAAAATLAHPDFAVRVLDRLAHHGTDPSRLHLEVTETTLLTLSEHVRATIGRLADAGVRWYVDDFGTGYSSISHLRDLPIAGLKLDRSFTADAVTGQTSRQLANALAALATGLGLDTVAEGVETRQQAALLLEQGWRHAQGWLFGRPAPRPALPRG